MVDVVVREKSDPDNTRSDESPSDAAGLDHSMVDASTANAAGELPERLGCYRIQRLLGAGATGRVYEALDETLNRRVALKVLKLSQDDARARERLRREAQAMASVDHRNVLEVYSTSEASPSEGGHSFIAMKFAEGGDLKSMLERDGPLPLDWSLDAMAQAAEGLMAAHQKDILHRDIKPANLLLDAEHQHLYVADFGLAREHSVDSSLTATGMIVGTPLYVSPELIEEGQGDVRSDIYSLGATFYHLLTGHPPFEGKTAAATLISHVSEPVPEPRLQRPELPSSVSRILRRCLMKDPEQRYQDYSELLADLTALKNGEALSMPPLMPPLRPELKLSARERRGPEISVQPRKLVRARERRSERSREYIPPQRVTSLRTPASAVVRFAAFFVDSVTLGFMSMCSGLFAQGLQPYESEAFSVGALLCFVVLSVIFEGLGASPGKALLSLEVHHHEGSPAGTMRRLLRMFMTRPLYLLPMTFLLLAAGMDDSLAAPLLVGLFLCFVSSGLSVMSSSSGRSLHDWASGTKVVQESHSSDSRQATASLLRAYMLWLPPWGFFGFHHMYLRRTIHGLLSLGTVSFFLIGWVVDALFMSVWVSQARD